MTSEAQPLAAPARKSGYMPSLDGWRAIAILGVMMTHDLPWNIFGRSFSFYQAYGGYGVALFFAISGLLITTRILEEESIVGSFHIGRFYIRRLFRIQPASWAYLLCLAVLFAIGTVPAEWFNWLGSLFLFTNFTFHPLGPPSVIGHFWSLAVEEHFYILLSLTLLVIKNRRLLTLCILFAISMVPTWFAYPQSHGWYDPNAAPRSTQWQLHYLFLAALAAVLLRRDDVLRAVKTLLRPWVVFPLTLLLAIAHNMLEQALRHQPIAPLYHLLSQSEFLATYCFILWIVATVFHPRSVTTRVLESRPLRFIGRISYSLYLWHVLFFYGAGGFRQVHGWLIQTLSGNIAHYLAAFTVATLSYYYIEKPFMRLGHRLAPPATPGRPEFADLPVEALDQPQPAPRIQ